MYEECNKCGKVSTIRSCHFCFAKEYKFFNNVNEEYVRRLIDSKCMKCNKIFPICKDCSCNHSEYDNPVFITCSCCSANMNAYIFRKGSIFRDINGNHICEGDILVYPDNAIKIEMVVYFDCDLEKWYVKPLKILKNYAGETYADLLYVVENGAIVIGNIHE